jgi:hypothetical protein
MLRKAQRRLWRPEWTAQDPDFTCLFDDRVQAWSVPEIHPPPMNRQWACWIGFLALLAAVSPASGGCLGKASLAATTAG